MLGKLAIEGDWFVDARGRRHLQQALLLRTHECPARSTDPAPSSSGKCSGVDDRGCAY